MPISLFHQQIEKLLTLLQQSLGNSYREPFPVEEKLADLGLSSVGMMSLMLAVEAEFGLEIPAQDITPENFHSLTTIAALISRLQASNVLVEDASTVVLNRGV